MPLKSALTLPSRGRATSGFASCRPPLMSNVRARASRRRSGWLALAHRRAMRTRLPSACLSRKRAISGRAVQLAKPEVSTRTARARALVRAGAECRHRVRAVGYWQERQRMKQSVNQLVENRCSPAAGLLLTSTVATDGCSRPCTPSPNPSIEGTCNIWLRQLSPAPHVKR
jgi:hypothetical protein